MASEARRPPIRSDWATTLNYDVLQAANPMLPIFVGRPDLLQPLVASICETGKRGTILISGHRGSRSREG